MKALSFLTIVLVASHLTFFGCLHGPAKVQSGSFVVGNWAEFAKGNRLPHSSLEDISEQRPGGWQGKGCRISDTYRHGGGKSLYLGAENGETVTCASEKMEVVAGHYEVSVWMRMGDLHLNANRLATDVVSIRLHAWDRWGKVIRLRAPYLGREIGVGELNFGLGQWRESSLSGFQKLHLAARFHPFDYGWLPANVAQVQLEITLKGSVAGPVEIWLDDFELKYSKWNFPLEERVEKLGKDLLSLEQAQKNLYVVAQPQQVGEQIELWALGPLKSPHLCLSGEVSGLFKEGVQAIEEKLKTFGYQTPLARGSCAGMPYVLLFDQGKFPYDISRVTEPLRKIVREKGKESYAIWPIPLPSGQKILFVTAGEPRGMTYALQTLKQMFVRLEDGRVYLQAVTIFDYPAFPLRMANGRTIQVAKWLPETRLNALLLDFTEGKSKWWEISRDDLNLAKSFVKESQEKDLFDFGLLLNFYRHRSDETLENTLQFSNSSLFKKVEEALIPFSPLKPRHLFLCADDLAPTSEGERFSYVLESAQDQKTFGSLAKAHGDLIAKLQRKLDREKSEMKLYFVPPYYNNRFVDLSKGYGEPYLHELAKNLASKVPVLWTGPTVRSLWLNAIDLARFSGFLNGRIPMLWDNTLYARGLHDFWGAHPERAHLASYLEPYDVQSPVDYEPWRKQPGVFLNSHTTELFRMQLVSAGSFYWNPDKYEPEKVLWRYLQERFGEEGAKHLLHFDALFWQDRETKSQKPAVRASLRSELEWLEKNLPGENSKLLEELQGMVL